MGKSAVGVIIGLIFAVILIVIAVLLIRRFVNKVDVFDLLGVPFNIVTTYGDAHLSLEETEGIEVEANRTAQSEIYSQAILPDLQFARPVRVLLYTLESQ